MRHDQLAPFVLKDGETFAMLDPRGEIDPSSHPDSGIFHRGTRQVSRLQLLLWDQPPRVLSSTERGEMGLHVSHLSNESSAGAAPSQGSLHLERSSLVTADSCLQQLSFTSFEPTPLRVPISLRFDADFRDIVEVRGIERARRGSAAAGAVPMGCFSPTTASTARHAAPACASGCLSRSGARATWACSWSSNRG